METFEDKLSRLLKERGKTIYSACFDMDISACTIYHRRRRKCVRSKSTIMAWAYYLGITAEDLVEGTDHEDYWWGGERKRTEGVK